MDAYFLTPQLKKAKMHNIQSPRSDDQGVEQLILEKGKTAPRVTPADVECNIAGEYYFTAGDGISNQAMYFAEINAIDSIYRLAEDIPTLNLLTFCVLVLKNGFTVTGESACASPENFDAEIGKRIARANAVNKIWSLMGYELRSQLAKAGD